MSKSTNPKGEAVIAFAQDNGFSIAESRNKDTGGFTVTAFVPSQKDFPIEGDSHFHTPEAIITGHLYKDSNYQAWGEGDTLQAALDDLYPKFQEQIHAIEATREDERKRLESLPSEEAQLEGDTDSAVSTQEEKEKETPDRNGEGD